VGKFFFFRRRVQTCSGAYPATCPIKQVAVFAEYKASPLTYMWCRCNSYGATPPRPHVCHGVVLSSAQEQLSLAHVSQAVIHIFISSLTKSTGGTCSVVSTATAYGLDGPGIESRWGRDFPHLSRPALRTTQPPVQWVPGLSRGEGAAGA
jgi:hypothetical protein